MAREDRRPVLKLDLVHKLGVLIILNIMPIIAGLFLFSKWIKGELIVTNVSVLWAALVILIASIIYVICFWMLMPTAKWFREYAFWQFKRGVSMVWFIPLVLAHVLWLLMWIFCIVAGLAATVAVILVTVHAIRSVRGM